MSEYDPAEQPAESDSVSESGEPISKNATGSPAEEGSVRRPLIRATLKPGEGAPPPPRQAPVFTMHQLGRGGPSQTRGGSQQSGNRAAYGNGHPNKQKPQKPRSSRSRRQTDRDGQRQQGHGSRPSGRRGKGRSR